MNKKTIVLSVVLLFNTFYCFPQIHVWISGYPVGSVDNGKVIFTDARSTAENKVNLESTTTVFAYNTREEPYLEEIDNILKDNWTLTPYVIASYDSLKYFKGTRYSFFTINMEVGFNGVAPLYYFELWQNGKKGEDKYSSRFVYARVDLFPVDTTYNYFSKQMRHHGYFKAFDEVHDRATYHNYNLAFLKLYIKTINYYMTEKKGIANNDIDIKNLQTSTLYLPDYMTIKVKRNQVNMDVTEKPGENITPVFKDYKHPYKLVNDKEFQDIMNDDKTHYYACYENINTDQMQIINTKTGEVIFACNWYGLKMLAKEMEK